jgi:hypothetical protein
MDRKLSAQRPHRLTLIAVLFIAVCALWGSFYCYSQARKELQQRANGCRLCEAQHRLDKDGMCAMVEWLHGQARQLETADPPKIELVRADTRWTFTNWNSYRSCRSAVDSAHPYEAYRTYALILFFCGLGIPAVFVAVIAMRNFLFIKI